MHKINGKEKIVYLLHKKMGGGCTSLVLHYGEKYYKNIYETINMCITKYSLYIKNQIFTRCITKNN